MKILQEVRRAGWVHTWPLLRPTARPVRSLRSAAMLIDGVVCSCFDRGRKKFGYDFAQDGILRFCGSRVEIVRLPKRVHQALHFWKSKRLQGCGSLFFYVSFTPKNISIIGVLHVTEFILTHFPVFREISIIPRYFVQCGLDFRRT
jgi:hypothetical protein